MEKLTLFKCTILLFALLFVAHAKGQEGQAKESWKDKLTFNMVIGTDFSYAFNKNRLQKAEFFLKPEVQYQIHKNVKLVGIGRGYLEALDRLEPGRPKQSPSAGLVNRRLFLGDRLELELREFYLQTRIKKKWYVRLGKQQIVWGETDGLKLLDVINPQYFREFVLDEFEDSRVPLWSLKADFPIGKLKVQFIWIPDQTYHVLPSFHAPFFPGSEVPKPPPGVGLNILEADRPNSWLVDSDIGFKMEAFVKGWDIGLNYFFHYDDFPALNQSLVISDTGQPQINIQPRYERQHLLGMTFNKPVGSVTLRGELAYTFKKPFVTTEERFSNGITTSDYFQVAIGMDYLFGEWMISSQVFNDILMKEFSAFNRDQYEVNGSLLVSREFFNDSFKAQILWVQNLNRGDAMLRPGLSYWLESNLQLFLQSDIFYGTPTGLFGQFRDQSRISLGLELGI